MTWVGRRITHWGLFETMRAGNLLCEMESFWFNDHHEMSQAELAKFLAPYVPFKVSPSSFDGENTYTFLIGRTGAKFALMLYRHDSNSLSVMSMNKWEQSYKPWVTARVQAYSQQQQNAQLQLRVPSSSPDATPTGAKNDCLIVATEALARLSKTAAWAKIVGFTVNKDGEPITGHALVIYQPTSSSNVWAYDRTGSADLHTRSHDLTDIAHGYNQLLKSNYRISDIKWIDDAAQTSQSTNDLVDTAEWKKSTPAPTATPASTPVEQTAAYQIGYYGAGAICLALYVWAIVVCFMKGKPRFASLGIIALLCGLLSWFAIIGACRIAKPHSWWARKKYGPEKMKIALQRFASLYKESTRKAIEQSIQAIDISQRVRA
jgi:hypothetical protein